MARKGPAKLTSFAFSDEKVIFPTPLEVAIATYEVTQGFLMQGQAHETVCFDTTTWVRSDGRWLAALHAETPKQKCRGG